jgi:hypothetical protein
MGGVGVDEAANPRTNPGRISANMLICTASNADMY